jgi:hypothetical protein
MLTWSGIAVGEGHVLAEFIPSSSVSKGIVVHFISPPPWGDVWRPSIQRAPATVLKADQKLGLMLLVATSTTEINYPELAEPVVGEKVRWVRYPHGSLPRESLLGEFSDDLLTKLPDGTLLFNEEHQYLIGMVTTNPVTKKTQFLGEMRLYGTNNKPQYEGRLTKLGGPIDMTPYKDK